MLPELPPNIVERDVTKVVLTEVSTPLVPGVPTNLTLIAGVTNRVRVSGAARAIVTLTGTGFDGNKSATAGGLIEIDVPVGGVTTLSAIYTLPVGSGAPAINAHVGTVVRVGIGVNTLGGMPVIFGIGNGPSGYTTLNVTASRGPRVRVVADRGSLFNDTTYNPLQSGGAGTFTPTNNRGAYDAGTAYAVGDYVTQGVFTYTAKTSTTGNAPPTTATSNTNWQLVVTSASYKTRFRAKGSFRNLRLYYSLCSAAGSTYFQPGPSELIEFRATVDKDAYQYNVYLPNRLPAYFTGMSAPIGVRFTSNEEFDVSNYLRVSPGGKWNLNKKAYSGGDATTDPSRSSGDGGDSTGGMYTFARSANLQSYSSYPNGAVAPAYVLGEFIGVPPGVAAISGDSIPSGSGTSDGRSWIVRALQAAGWNTYLISAPGSTANVNANYGIGYNEMAEYCDYEFMAIGTNDIGGSTNVENVYASMLNYAEILSCGGRRPVVAATILPRNGSSDNFANVSNSTVMGDKINNFNNNGSGLVRVQASGKTLFSNGDTVTIKGVVGTGNLAALNGQTYTIALVDNNPTLFDLIGSSFGGTYSNPGAASNITKEAMRVTINTRMRDGTFVSALKARGVTAMVVDPCAVVEVNESNVLTQNGGLLITTGTAGAYTTDGVHPTDALSDILKTVVVPINYPLYE